MTIKFTNNATTTLASGITNVATSLTVASGTGALFPSLSGSDVFYATLANTGGTVEIVKVTARSTDTFTIVRGQDGTSAVSWSTGDKVELRVTAADLAAMTQTADLAAGNGMSLSGTTFTATGSTLNSQTSAYVLVAGDAGKTISITTGGVAVNNSVMSAGNIVTIYNNSGSSQTITQGTGVTLQWAGQASSTTGNRTLGLYGMATIVFLSASSAVITGSGLT